jgi:hypothetical protein
VFSGLNLAYAQTYNFSFTTPYTITSTSEAAVKIWADLTSDAIHILLFLITKLCLKKVQELGVGGV